MSEGYTGTGEQGRGWSTILGADRAAADGDLASTFRGEGFVKSDGVADQVAVAVCVVGLGRHIVLAQ